MPDSTDSARAAGDLWKEFDQNVISHSAAHHLMAIDDLISHLGYARVSDIARKLSITRGSVSISLGPLKKAGLVDQDENRHLRLSAHGQALVTAIKTKRHLLIRLLAEVLGVGAAQAELDACKIEHLVSNETARRLLGFLRCLDDPGGTGRGFLASLRDADAGCPQTPGACPTCKDDCMAARVEDGPQKGSTA